MQALVERLTSDRKLAPHAVYTGVAPGRGPELVEPRAGWSADAAAAAAALGVTQLYRHQAEALELVAAGTNVLLATPTASGKTLAYLLGFLARRALDPEARAIFVYPLKALARDQLGAIRRALAALGLPPEQAAEVYDGDTPDTVRRRIRRNPPAVLVTNPDMLHLGIVPHHDTWSRFLGALALVVIDEAHVYRGIFGAHVHHVLRRLLRAARLHGAQPVLLGGSATIGAPREFVETLTGEPFRVVSRSGAPCCTRHVLFFAPTAVSPYTLATRVIAQAVRAGSKTIAFTKARRITELIHQWIRQMQPDIAARVASYRSGYLPEERREIERRLFRGELDAVVSTSALEAGIDVGGLDVCVLVGYPGSLATAWQRIGRAGRTDRDALAVLVALPDALDRYVVDHPEHFFSGEFERVVLDPANDSIADAHLAAAGAERSLDGADVEFLAGPGGRVRVERLVAEGRLVEAHEEQRWFCLRRRPQREIQLRSAGQPYVLRAHPSGRQLGTLDEGRAWFEGHPGAIYLHAGQSWRALDLDRDARVVTLEPVDVDWFTQVYARKETEILERTATRALEAVELSLGRLRVTTFIEGYGRRRLFTQEEISRHPLEDAPPQVMETWGFWVKFPPGTLETLVEAERHPVGALHALEHAAIGLFPLLAICDRWDLGGISYAHHPQVGAPAVFVYDGWPGGVGLARTGYERARELFERTLALLEGCHCEEGCPSCVISPKCGAGNHPLDKQGAIDLVEILLGHRSVAAASEPERVAPHLAQHRSGTHAGVRGGGRLPEGFFADAAGGAGPAAAPAPEQQDGADGFRWPADLPPPGKLLRDGEERWLFFDLETQRSAEEVGGWGRIDRMGLALGITMDAATGEYRTYRAEDAERLCDDLLAADRVVGFNLDRFDITVLAGCVGQRVRTVRTLDLLALVRDRLGFRLKLASLAEATLGVGKSADGLQCLAWVREGRWDLIERYCRDDVALTAALWAYGRHHGYVLFRTREGPTARIPVRW
jgi:DEAD/DEAH box helicase domain-containing protein